jgi:GNAT superfamily N-acetyltransferase
VPDYISAPLSSSHNRKSFSCGKSPLDEYFHKQVSQDIKRKIAVCFVLEADKREVKGYYTLSSEGIPRKDVPETVQNKMPRAYASLPVTLLGRLAVDQNWQGKGIGKALLIDALKRAHEASHEVGSIAVVVDPIDKEAEEFYASFDFIKLPTSGRMFLPMKTIARLF